MEKTVSWAVRIPDGVRRQIKIKAAEADISMNAWIVRAIEEKLERDKGGKS